jgi:hypothetical protein
MAVFMSILKWVYICYCALWVPVKSETYRFFLWQSFKLATIKVQIVGIHIPLNKMNDFSNDWKETKMIMSTAYFVKNAMLRLAVRKQFKWKWEVEVQHFAQIEWEYDQFVRIW